MENFEKELNRIGLSNEYYSVYERLNKIDKYYLIFEEGLYKIIYLDEKNEKIIIEVSKDKNNIERNFLNLLRDFKNRYNL